jgi:hypothetical protein
MFMSPPGSCDASSILILAEFRRSPPQNDERPAENDGPSSI